MWGADSSTNGNETGGAVAQTKPQQPKLEARNPKFETSSKFEVRDKTQDRSKFEVRSTKQDPRLKTIGRSSFVLRRFTSHFALSSGSQSPETP